MTKQEQLEEALAARHKLLVGQAVVTLGHGPRRLEYTAASLAALDAYIAQLRREIAGKARSSRNLVRYGVPR